MKNILTTLLVLFALIVNAQDRDTIYDFGIRTPKEVDSLEKAGHTVIRYSTSNSVFRLFTETYDTVDVQGLALYISDDEFEYGVDFKLLPTIKTVRTCANCFNSFNSLNGYGTLNNFKLRFDKETISVKQLEFLAELRGKCLDCPVPSKWKEVDLTKYKEFLFIEKPK